MVSRGFLIHRREDSLSLSPEGFGHVWGIPLCSVLSPRKFFRLLVDHALRDVVLIAYFYCGTEQPSARMDIPVQNISH
jgi:hypothetical protein